VNSIGGAFDFGQLSNAGVNSVEVLRGSNSVLYGSDALSGVVNITSSRGTSAIPEVKYSVDGGNFRTLNQDVSLGGAFVSSITSPSFRALTRKVAIPTSLFTMPRSAPI